MARGSTAGDAKTTERKTRRVRRAVSQQAEVRIGTRGAGADAPVKVLTERAAVKTLMDPFRMRLMEELVSPATIKELADRIGRPVTSLYHHINKLDEHGFIEVVEELPSGKGGTERVFRTVEAIYRTGPDLAGVALDRVRMLDGDDPVGRFFDEFLRARTVKDETEEAERFGLASSIGLTPDGASELFERIEGLVRDLTTVREDDIDESGEQGSGRRRSYRLVVALAPDDTEDLRGRA